MISRKCRLRSVGLSLLVAGLRHHPVIGLPRLPAAGVLLLGLLVGHRGHDDHVVAALPVNGRRDLVLGRELQ